MQRLLCGEGIELPARAGSIPSESKAVLEEDRLLSFDRATVSTRESKCSWLSLLWSVPETLDSKGIQQPWLRPRHQCPLVGCLVCLAGAPALGRKCPPSYTLSIAAPKAGASPASGLAQPWIDLYFSLLINLFSISFIFFQQMPQAVRHWSSLFCSHLTLLFLKNIFSISFCFSTLPQAV